MLGAPAISSPARLEKYARARWTDISQTVLKWNGQVMEPAGEHMPVSGSGTAAVHLLLQQAPLPWQRGVGMQACCTCTGTPCGAPLPQP